MYCFGGEKLMLLMFKVKNYTSFKNEAILDMRATAYVQHPTHVMQVNDKLGLPLCMELMLQESLI